MSTIMDRAAGPSRVKQALTDEECYLAAILLDQSGLDQAEFLWKDSDPAGDGCYRAHPHQWRWWRCRDPRQIDQCGRCVAGGTLLRLSPTMTAKISSLVDTHPRILAPSSDGSLEYRAVSEVFASGERELLRVVTASGRELQASTEHRLLTPDGWVELADLSSGVQVAVQGENGIEWDHVDGINEAGRHETFDVEMLGFPSLIANGFVVHNSTGKSEGIMARILAFPFSFPGQEQALVTPEKKHIDTLAERVEAKINESRFYTALLKGGARDAITHQPFKIIWANGARLLGKLPLRTGLGLKGLHPVRLEVDEGQDIGDKAYRELPEVVRWEIPGARWMIHGVSKGVQDTFYHYTQEGSGFKVHRIMGMHNPGWDAETKRQRMQEYGGSATSPDFQRNVYGNHASAMNRIVVLERLYACVDTEPSSDYNTSEYKHYTVTPEIVSQVIREKHGKKAAELPLEDVTDEQIAAVGQLLTFPAEHRSHYKSGVYWAGMDVGLVADPSELIVAVEYQPGTEELALDRRMKMRPPDKGLSRLRILTRIHMERLPPDLQQEVVMRVIEFYEPRAVSLDKTGNGLAIFTSLQRQAVKDRIAVVDYTATDETAEGAVAANPALAEQAKKALTKIKGYNFSQKIVVEFDYAKVDALINPTTEELVKEAGIQRWVKDFATDLVREVIDERRARLPHDPDLINDINAQTWATSQEPIDAYGKRRYAYSAGTFHLLDALRMLLVGRHMDAIELFINKKPAPDKPVHVRFGF